MSWSELYASRKAVRRRYRRVWNVPLARRCSDVARDALTDGMCVIEIGAGDRRLGGRLRKWFPRLIYESVDIDRRLPHDYYSMDEVAGPYDAAILFEVLEHLPLEEGRHLLLSTGRVLRPGGVLLVSTPNVFNPSRFWRDATHAVAYAYDELGGLITMSGFELRRLVRVHNDSFFRLLLRRYVFAWLFRLLNLDFANSIVAVAERPMVDAPRQLGRAE